MAPKKGAIQTKHGYSDEDLIAILEKVIPIYKSSNVISFHTVLENHCTYRQMHWDHILHNRTIKSEKIESLFTILRDLQEQKIINGAMTGEYNPAFSMFFLKSKRGWCEEQHKARLKLDEKKLDAGVTDSKEFKIEISVVPASVSAKNADGN